MIIMDILKFIFVILLCIPLGYVVLGMNSQLREQLKAKLNGKKRRSRR